jgi:uncharacterized protein (UPF0332 family)
MSLSILLSEKLSEKLREEGLRRGISAEELVIDVLSKALDVPLDPQDRAELHLKLCEKYLREADELLAKGDYVQASEKGWGAAAQIVKALVAKEGGELRSHRDLWLHVDELVEKLGSEELRDLWHAANALHQNFYENWMTPKGVAASLKRVKMFIERLKGLL